MTPDGPIASERIDAGPIALVFHGPDQAASIADAINESLEHLQPWMAWAQRPTNAQEQAMRLAMIVERARAGGEMSWTIVNDEGRVRGGSGFHLRGPVDSIDIGYWLHVDATGRGYATWAAGALTRVAFDVLDKNVVRITCDEANIASAGVPRRLGFAHVETIAASREAPSDTGRTMVWVMTREDWPKSHAATLTVSYSS